MRPPSTSSRGFVLYSVLVMVLLCSMIAVSLLFSMRAEQTAFSAGEQGEQAWAAALSGVHHAIHTALNTPAGWLTWQDNAAEFHHQLVVNDGSDDWFFTIYQMGGKDEETLRYGLSDEASKLNLIHAPPGWMESSASPLLSLLKANRAAETGEGASNSFFLDLAMPRGLPATAPEVLDAFMAAARIDPRVLFGKDLDLNLRPDPGTEDSGEIFQQGVGSGGLAFGLRHFLTTVSYDRNLDSQNRPRLDLNTASAARLAKLDLPDTTTRYLRQMRRSGKKLAHPSELLEAVTRFQTKSNKTVELSSGVKGEELAILLDYCTATNATILPGLININTAPHEVLTLLPGVNDSLADSIIATRQGLNADQLKTPAWLYQQGLLNADEFKKTAPLLTARSWQYHFHVVGYSIPSARYRVLEVVVDVATTPPQILSLRDLTRLGLPFKVNASPETEGGVPTSPHVRAESANIHF